MPVGAGWRDGIEEARFGPSHLCSSSKTVSFVCFLFVLFLFFVVARLLAR